MFSFDAFDIKLPTKVGMPLNNGAKTETVLRVFFLNVKLLMLFAGVVKVTSLTGVWDNLLAWYSPIDTRWIC